MRVWIKWFTQLIICYFAQLCCIALMIVCGEYNKQNASTIHQTSHHSPDKPGEILGLASTPSWLFCSSKYGLTCQQKVGLHQKVLKFMEVPFIFFNSVSASGHRCVCEVCWWDFWGSIIQHIPFLPYLAEPIAGGLYYVKTDNTSLGLHEPISEYRTLYDESCKIASIREHANWEVGAF